MRASILAPPLPARQFRAGVHFDGEWRPALWQVGLAVAVTFVLLALPLIIAFRLHGPDDYMRLLQVRDWLAGQSWFDVRQYRMGTSAGADMPWTRLVDVPIAGSMLLFDLILPAAAAERAALIVVPLLSLLLAMVLLRQLLRELRSSEQVSLATLAILPLFPLLPSSFGPMRIDHNAWQGVAMLAVTWLMLRGGWRAAFAAGGVASLWLNISLDGLPLAAILGGLFAIRYWLHGKRDHEAYLLGVALGSPVLFLLTRPGGTLSIPYCDAPSWPHFLAFGSAAAIAAGARLMPHQARPPARLASLAPIAPLATTLMIAPLGTCALFPTAALDPAVRHNWFANIAESAPLTSQSPSVAITLLWTIGLTIAGTRLALKQPASAALRERWLMLAAVALAAGVLSLWVMRVALIAQLLALPFAALVLTHLLPRARAWPGPISRVAATLVCFALATPIFASAAMKPFHRQDPLVVVEPPTEASGKRCDLTRLNTLPSATLFAPLDAGPEILVRTSHRVIMGGYPRNQRLMREVVDGFAGPLGDARRTIVASRADYVIACTSTSETALYAGLNADNLADRLITGSPPSWLEPDPEFVQGHLKVWRVRR